MIATDPRVVGFHLTPDQLEEPSPGEISITPGHVAEILDTLQRGPGGARCYAGALYDLWDGAPLDAEPTRLSTKGEARRWWTANAPAAPIPAPLLD